MLSSLSEGMKRKAAKVLKEDMAWSYPDILDVIDAVSKKGYVIMGGRVFERHMDFTYDEWNYKYSSRDTKEVNAVNSLKKAIDFVETYRLKNGDSYYYSLICE